MKTSSRKLFALLTAGVSLAAVTSRAAEAPADWTSALISPVANPIFFESPAIGSEVRPLFIYHNLNDDFVTGGGNVQVYALQFRLKLTERLALIATKDGYIDFNPNSVLPHTEGWADIAAGLKYALINDEQGRFILTPGVKFEIPLGDEDVFQGNGNGELDLFVSAAKGFDKLQVMGSLGVRLPFDSDEETSQLHYSLQLAYDASRWFKPFVCLNGYTVLSEGDGLALGSEGYDVINFGTSNASGENQIVLGAGFRSSLCKCMDIGFAYEKGVTHDDGIFDDRFTADLVWKF